MSNALDSERIMIARYQAVTVPHSSGITGIAYGRLLPPNLRSAPHYDSTPESERSFQRFFPDLET
jgi:hypothetical protein